MILSTKRAIRSVIGPEPGSDSSDLLFLLHIAERLAEADYGTLFPLAISAVVELRPWLSQRRTVQCEKLGYRVLSSAVALSRLITLVSFNDTSPSMPNEEIANPSSPLQSPIRTESGVRRRSNQLIRSSTSSCALAGVKPTYVICRICEKEVPLFLIEAHSANCVQAYESSKSMISTEDRMKKLQALARQTVLRREWPGPEGLALNTLIPILHAVILLDRAIAIDPATESANDELGMICEAMMPIAISIMNPEAGQIMKRACLAISEKVNAAAKLSEAMYVVHCTSRSPVGDSPKSIGQTTIADFEFIKRISSGAYARVFLARKRRTGDIYAIKVIPKSGLSQKNEVRRVLAEKDILLTIHSPSMIKFFYSVIGEHNLYLVMEYLPGGDLYSVLQNIGSLSEDDARIYTAQIVSALEFLRGNRIIHRDIKPDNILVDSSGHLKLTDFGLSFYGMVDRSINSTQVSTVIDNSIVGTPDYTAPEIVLSQSHTFTADYWAVGAILYEFLTGVPPFHGETPSETFQNIVKGISSSDDLEDFTPEAQDLIAKLLEPNPEKRLGAQSIAEIKEHPWFAGIPWERLEELQPPFVPELSNVLDTSYFEERYSFPNREENDILEDVRIATEHLRPPRKSRRSSAMSVLDDTEEDEMEMFPSVSVQTLREATDENARQMRLTHDSDDNIGELLNVTSPGELTPVKKAPGRRVPRCSLSPKGKAQPHLSPSMPLLS
jgi:serine/threonine protein kinase